MSLFRSCSCHGALAFFTIISAIFISRGFAAFMLNGESVSHPSLNSRPTGPIPVADGYTVMVNGVSYYIDGKPLYYFPNSSRRNGGGALKSAAGGGLDLRPVTVMAAAVTNSSIDIALKVVAEAYGASDDVWTKDFLDEIYLEPVTGRHTPVPLPKVLKSTLNLNLTSRPSHLTMLPPYNITKIPPGPYFLDHSSGAVHKANRLYSDTVKVFTEPLVRNAQNDAYLKFSSYSGSNPKSVAVPSKLYYSRSLQKPLAGIRLGVEDNLDVAGTTNNYDKPAPHKLPITKANSMAAIQKLEDSGAEIIGKTSSSPSSGPPGYGKPYDWIDLTLGLDKKKYIRSFAQDHGLFGNRFTSGLMDMKGMSPADTFGLDTLGLLAHDVKDWVAAGKVLSPSIPPEGYPKKIYVIHDTNLIKNANMKSLITDILHGMMMQIGSKSEVLDLQQTWIQSKPKDLDTNLDKTINTIYKALIANKSKPSEFKKAQKDQKTFAAWLQTHILKVDADTCSDSLVIYAAGAASSREKTMFGRLAPLDGLPEAVFPIGMIHRPTKKQALQHGKPQGHTDSHHHSHTCSHTHCSRHGTRTPASHHTSHSLTTFHFTTPPSSQPVSQTLSHKTFQHTTPHRVSARHRHRAGNCPLQASEPTHTTHYGHKLGLGKSQHEKSHKPTTPVPAAPIGPPPPMITGYNWKRQPPVFSANPFSTPTAATTYPVNWTGVSSSVTRPTLLPSAQTSATSRAIYRTPVKPHPYLKPSTHHATLASNKEMPVAINIIAAKGCDALLFNLALELSNAGVLHALPLNSKAHSTPHASSAPAKLGNHAHTSRHHDSRPSHPTRTSLQTYTTTETLSGGKVVTFTGIHTVPMPPHSHSHSRTRSYRQHGAPTSHSAAAVAISLPPAISTSAAMTRGSSTTIRTAGYAV